MHKYVFELVHRSLCDLLDDNDQPFGGKIVLLGGDFRQILSVIRQGNEADIVDSTLKRSFLWNSITIRHLTQNMRSCQATSPTLPFQDFLLSIGDGKRPTEPEIDKCAIQLPDNICIQHPEQQGLQKLISAVFPDTTNINYHRAILCARNNNVDKINDHIIQTMQHHGPAVTYFSADSVSDDAQTYMYPTEFLNTLNLSGLPPHKLTLRPSTPVILIRNLDQKNG
ncbi:uncharacterized protein LOC135484773 [Lineus longissimus]|uniref:uncharacterized protein LOC135484773 n=1 Tax=Lineus longissimus TaxID=88925 RepID=UPI00315D9D7C